MKKKAQKVEAFKIGRKAKAIFRGIKGYGDFRRDLAISLKGSRPEVSDSLSFGVVVVGGSQN